MSTIKMLVADDHEVVRCGLRTLLADTEIEIIAEVGTGEAAVRYAIENDPDLDSLRDRPRFQAFLAQLKES